MILLVFDTSLLTVCVYTAVFYIYIKVRLKDQARKSCEIKPLEQKASPTEAVFRASGIPSSNERSLSSPSRSRS